MNEIDDFPDKIEDDNVSLEIRMVVDGQTYAMRHELTECTRKTYLELAEEIDNKGRMLIMSCSGLFKGKHYDL